MWILVANSTENLLINIAIYAVLFNIMYSMIFNGKEFWANVILYVIAMEIKLFITAGEIPISSFFISIAVYVIIGLIIVKIAYTLADHTSRISFVLASIAIGYLLEIMLTTVLYQILNIVMFFVGVFLLGHD